MRNFHYFIFAFALIFLLSLICSACKKSKEDTLKDADNLQPGDVVFRLGDSPESNAIMVADPEAAYSHVGIVVSYMNKMKIVHACPGDNFEINDSNLVRMDRPEVFFSNKNCLQGAIYRYANRDFAKKAAEEAISMYENKIPFDFNFEAEDSSALYCTELVTLAYHKAGVELTDGTVHDVDMPGAFVPACILISDIQKSDKLELISSFK